MNFGRRRNQPEEATTGIEDEATVDETAGDDEVDEETADVAEGEELEEYEDDDPDADEIDQDDDEVDYRADGPFDIEEVDLGGDEVTRIDLGTLIITPWPGLNLQLQVNEGTQQVQAVTGVWQKSGLEIALFAAPAHGGLAREFREDVVEEAQQAGGTTEVVEGPFGPEIRRVLPQTGPKGEQLFHVSRVWFVEGPRWLLRGTLLGEAALDQDETASAPFLEFFRNLVVRRGDKPMVPGGLMTMELPQSKER